MEKPVIRILLIDDEVEFTSTLATRLGLRGFEVETGENGEEGISLLRAGHFDVVALDLMMPGMNGLETLRQIRGLNQEVPVILLTGHGSTREGIEAMRIGASDYLMKPLDIDDFLKKINDVCPK